MSNCFGIQLQSDNNNIIPLTEDDYRNDAQFFGWQPRLETQQCSYFTYIKHTEAFIWKPFEKRGK